MFQSKGNFNWIDLKSGNLIVNMSTIIEKIMNVGMMACQTMMACFGYNVSTIHNIQGKQAPHNIVVVRLSTFDEEILTQNHTACGHYKAYEVI